MDCFKQLHGINYELNIKSPSFMRGVISGSLEPYIHSGRIELVDVHRQKDPLLKNFFV